MRTICCLNLPPATSNPAFNASLPIKPPQLELVKYERRWRRQCIVMKLACTLIGLEMGSLVGEAQADGFVALAPHMLPLAAAKWSEKRACPSWRDNSLETIVPENLPRPAARRRYEAVRSKNAPSLSVAVQRKGNCFSM